MLTDTDTNILLTYAVAADPDPLQITPANATPFNSSIVVVVSNDTNKYIRCNSLVFELPPGKFAKDLTDDIASITTTVPDGWRISRNGGQFTATPATQKAGEIGPQGLYFTFSHVHVNSQVGTFPLMIIQDTEQGGSQKTTVQLGKFPVGFHVGDLNANPLTVDPGGSTTLSWQGSASANYQLEYGKTSKVVSNNGPYEVDHLETTTTFYLVVTTAVGDETVEIQRERTVTVNEVKILSFGANPDYIGTGETATLSWKTSNAISCTLNPGEISVPVNGSYPVQPRQTTTYELAAADEQGNVKHEPLTVTVDPNVILSDCTDSFVGADGRPGNPGFDGMPGGFGGGGDGHAGGPGTPGGPGDTGKSGADLQATVNLFAQHLLQVEVQLSTGGPQKRYLLGPAATLTLDNSGGAGGDGGKGGNGGPGLSNGVSYPQGNGADGGHGGAGGQGGRTNVAVPSNLLARSLQQLKFISQGGKGGKGGDGGSGAQGGNGGSGAHGGDGGTVNPSNFHIESDGGTGGHGGYPGHGGSNALPGANGLDGRAGSTAEQTHLALSTIQHLTSRHHSRGRIRTRTVALAPSSALPAPQVIRAPGNPPQMLLTYAVSTNPDPLQITPENTTPIDSTITLEVTNDTNKYIQCNSLEFAFPPGKEAKDLTNDIASITTTVPDGWNLSRNGGQFTFTPKNAEAGKLGPKGIYLSFGHVHVNSQIGTFPVKVIENTVQGGSLNTSIDLSKFPVGFYVGDLNANPLNVDPGGSTILSWNGAPDANYQLEYNQTVISVSNTGPYKVDDLETTTEFYLVVTKAVGDETVEVQRERQVTVNRPQIISFEGPRAQLVGDVQATFTWQTLNATRCELYADGVPVDVKAPLNSTGYKVKPTKTTTYTLYVYGQSNTNPAPSDWTVYYLPFQVTTFEVSPKEIEYLPETDNWVMDFTLTWQTVGLSGVSISCNLTDLNVGNVAASGNTTVPLPAEPSEPTTQTVTFTLSGTSVQGLAQASPVSAKIIFNGPSRLALYPNVVQA